MCTCHVLSQSDPKSPVQVTVLRRPGNQNVHLSAVVSSKDVQLIAAACHASDTGTGTLEVDS